MSKIVKKIIPILLVMLMLLSACPLQAMAASGTYEPVTGLEVYVEDATSTNYSDGAVTVTAKGSAGLFGFGASAKTTTIYVDNLSGEEALVSFDWIATDVNALVIDDTTITAGRGNFSKLIAAENGIEITVTTAKNATENTLVMKNFKLSSGTDQYSTTLEFDEALGSVTVGGTAVAAGDSQTVDAGEGLDLVATAKSSTFLGWTDSNGRIISKSATYTYVPSENGIVTAAFAATSPWFLVGDEYLCEGLASATAMVASASSKTIVLMNNATLPAGNYTIPSGATLLIPFDSANTIYTDTPETTGTSRVTPSVYRTLTMASGANITINGAISLSSKVVCGTGAGVPAGATSGPYGHIKMEESSSITVNSGANLYAWGYITGKGSVLAKSGATVYESFQVEDYRGGSQTTGMENKVFPLSQYYIQNIEVPLTLEAGVTEKCYTCINVSFFGEQGSSIPFISTSGSMFNIVSGSVTKYYDGSTDRLYIEIDGVIEMSPISMKVSLQTLNSSDYVLPITNNLTVSINSGSTITMTQDMAMLPGSEIIVEENALCDIAAGISVYAYDADTWGTYCWDKGNVTFSPIGYAPSKAYVRTTADLVDAKVVINGTIDATKGYLYTTAGGANVTSSGSGKIMAQPGTATVTYQVLQNIDENDNDSYIEIPITSAKLKNADGTFVETAGASGEYVYINGVWDKTCYTHTHVGSVTTPATCETAGVRTYTCECGDTYTEAIAATGHTAGVDATCANAQTCTVCGKELAAALEHTPGADATCTEAQTCTVCGETLNTALGHTEVIDEAVAATCTATGLTEGKHCSVCGVVTVAQQKVDALGHTPGADATCTEAQTCTVCGETLNAALGHTEVIDEAVAATCTATGLTEGKHCSACGEVLVAQQKVDALGHSYGEWYIAAEASENANGYFEKVCSACGDKLVDEFPYIEAKDVVITVTEAGKKAEIFADAAYLEQFASINAWVNGTDLVDYTVNGNSIVFTYNTTSDEALEIKFNAVTKNGNAVVSDSIFKNIDKIAGTAGEKFVVLEELYGSDANEDGKTDIKDLVRLKKMIAELADKVESADLSGDGNVAVNDMALLAKYIVRGDRGMKAYTVTFTDDDGTVLETAIVVEGFSAKPEITPEKEGYTFAGWDSDILHVASDLVVKALYQ